MLHSSLLLLAFHGTPASVLDLPPPPLEVLEEPPPISDFVPQPQPHPPSTTSRSRSNTSRKCMLIDEEGTVQYTYPSIGAAAKENGLDVKTVHRAVKLGRLTKKGGLRFIADAPPADDAQPPPLENEGEYDFSPHYRYGKDGTVRLVSTQTFKIEWKEVPGYKDYLVEPLGSRIWSKKNKSLLKPNGQDRVLLYDTDGNRATFYVYRVAYDAFIGIPEEKKHWHVDHLIEGRGKEKIHALRYLQLLPGGENVRKSHMIQGRDTAAAQSTKILQVDEDGSILHEYPSIIEAARQLAGKISEVSIRRALKSSGEKAINNFRFKKADDPDLEDEVWYDTSGFFDEHFGQVGKPESKKLRVSNKGRVITTHGTKTFGTQMTHKPKYSTIFYNGTHYYVHVVVFIAKNKSLPVGIVCHDDSAPKREDGRYRNWEEDLRDDTHRNNGKESHESGKQAATKKRKREEFDAIHNPGNDE